MKTEKPVTVSDRLTPANADYSSNRRAIELVYENRRAAAGYANISWTHGSSGSPPSNGATTKQVMTCANLSRRPENCRHLCFRSTLFQWIVWVISLRVWPKFCAGIT